jgi:hypothetical protein
MRLHLFTVRCRMIPPGSAANSGKTTLLRLLTVAGSFTPDKKMILNLLCRCSKAGKRLIPPGRWKKISFVYGELWGIVKHDEERKQRQEQTGRNRLLPDEG